MGYLWCSVPWPNQSVFPFLYISVSESEQEQAESSEGVQTMDEEASPAPDQPGQLTAEDTVISCPPGFCSTPQAAAQRSGKRRRHENYSMTETFEEMRDVPAHEQSFRKPPGEVQEMSRLVDVLGARNT